jgi:hypothetical protein
VRAPLARVPENTMKFVVGVLLTTFGTFWGAEGAGASWPGGDAALPFLALAVLALSLWLVRGLRQARGMSRPVAAGLAGAGAGAGPAGSGAIAPSAGPLPPAGEPAP